jgi:nucleolar protein 56
MENDTIVKWNIEQSKKEIQKNILKDRVVIFFTRIVEDSKRYRNPNFYGRIKEIYCLIYPYEEKKDTKIIFQELKNSDLDSKEGLVLSPQEKHFVKLFLKSLDNECKLVNQEKVKLIEKDLTRLVERYFPNSHKIIEPYILGKLISSVGGIDNLYKMPSSTIQLIGAEKAMFRHIAKNKPCPKYGLIFYSEKIKQAKDKGKTARQLANKLAISIKQDYFQNFAR